MIHWVLKYCFTPPQVPHKIHPTNHPLNPTLSLKIQSSSHKPPKKIQITHKIFPLFYARQINLNPIIIIPWPEKNLLKYEKRKSFRSIFDSRPIQSQFCGCDDGYEIFFSLGLFTSDSITSLKIGLTSAIYDRSDIAYMRVWWKLSIKITRTFLGLEKCRI